MEKSLTTSQQVRLSTLFPNSSLFPKSERKESVISEWNIPGFFGCKIKTLPQAQQKNHKK
jgi:hypothetical protein